MKPDIKMSIHSVIIILLNLKELHMQTQKVKTELLINDSKVTIGHQFLEDIVKNIPDIKENKAIFGALAKSDNPDIRESISCKDNLSKKTIHLLLDDENQEVVDNILSNSDLAKKINEDILFRIIKSDNIKHLSTIASSIDDYALCNICKLAKILSNHQNTSVRYSLVKWRVCDRVTTKILKKLSKDKDIDIAQEAKEELSRR